MTYNVCQHYPGGEVVTARRDNPGQAVMLAREFARQDPAALIIVRDASTGAALHLARTTAYHDPYEDLTEALRVSRRLAIGEGMEDGDGRS